MIKQFRNLIHPGRAIRTQEVTNANSASIAISLVGMILAEIESRRRSAYGYTAEQIVSKIQRDSTVSAILKHLLKDLNPHETERLLLKVVPEKYVEQVTAPWPTDEHVPPILADLFRTAYEQANGQLKARVGQRFVKILKEEEEALVFVYSRVFFRMSDLEYLPPDDAQLVKEHFFDRIKKGSLKDDMILALSGLGRFLLSEEVPRFLDPLVRTVCFGDSEKAKRAARDRIKDEAWQMKQVPNSRLLTRLDEWISAYRSRNDSDRADLIEELKSYVEIPF